MYHVITTDQIFDLLGAVSCHRDLIEIEHYILSHLLYYHKHDIVLFYQAIDLLTEIFVR